jgi:glucokinase
MLSQDHTSPEYLLGLDVGGTKILASVFDCTLRRIGRLKLSTKPERGTQAVLERITRAALYAIDEADLAPADIKAIGVAVPGVVNRESGMVLYSSLFQWQEFPLREELEVRLKLPVFVDNDANVAALGVHVVGLNSRPKNMLGVFVGAGIGAGLIINGELYRGFGNAAGEAGHIIVEANGPKCLCGHQGCWEALASRTALFRNIRTAVRGGEITVLTELAGPDLAGLRSGHLRKAIFRGDTLVMRVVQEAARYLGIGIANLVNIFNPELVILGGGVIEAVSKEMLASITETARDYAMPGVMEGVEIRICPLGDYAGITGAAVLARKLSK